MQKDLKDNSKESDKLEILSILVKNYEEIQYAVEKPNPIGESNF